MEIFSYGYGNGEGYVSGIGNGFGSKMFYDLDDILLQEYMNLDDGEGFGDGSGNGKGFAQGSGNIFGCNEKSYIIEITNRFGILYGDTFGNGSEEGNGFGGGWGSNYFLSDVSNIIEENGTGKCY